VGWFLRLSVVFSGLALESPSRSRSRYRFPADLVLRTSLTVSCILVPGRQDLGNRAASARIAAFVRIISSPGL